MENTMPKKQEPEVDQDELMRALTAGEPASEPATLDDAIDRIAALEKLVAEILRRMKRPQP